MKLLGFFNFFLFQWFFIRLARVFVDDFPVGWTWLKGVVPLSGWWGRYYYLWKGPSHAPKKE